MLVTRSIVSRAWALFKSEVETYNIIMCKKIHAVVSATDKNTGVRCGECHVNVIGDGEWCQNCGEPTSACFDVVDSLRGMPSPRVVKNEIVFPR